MKNNLHINFVKKNIKGDLNMKKKIEIVMDENSTKITTENMSLAEIAKAFGNLNAGEDLKEPEEDDEDDYDYEDDDDYECKDDDCDEDKDIEDEGNPTLRWINGMMRDKLDIVANAGYDVVAKIIAFDHEDMRCYGIEVTPAVSGVTKMPEYGLDICDNGSRAVVQNGNATLIVPYPIFSKPIAKRLELKNCHCTGEVVTCKPGEDTVNGISALVEMLKSKI